MAHIRKLCLCWMEDNMKFLRVTVIILLFIIFWHWPTILAGDRVTLDAIVKEWQASKIDEVHFEFKGELKDWYKAQEGDDFIPIEVSTSEPIRRPIVGKFHRNAKFGMRLEDNGQIHNQAGGVSISVQTAGQGMAGMRSVIINQSEKNSQVGSDAKTSSFLYWIDPLATKMCTRASKTGISELPLIDSPDFGQVARLTFSYDNKKCSMTIAKKFSWRPVSIDTDVDGVPQSRLTFKYSLISGARVVLDEYTDREFRTKELRSESTILLTGHRFTCSAVDIEVPVPRGSLVYDFTSGKETKHIVRLDGSNRPINDDELKLAKNWEEVIATDQGALFGPKQSSVMYRSLPWIAVTVILVLAYYIQFRRSNSS